MTSTSTPAVVIAGPTASGKSGLAVRIAREFGGVVINADSMQVTDALPLLTARPAPGDMALAPHRLYAVLPPTELCSAARWRDMAAMEMAAAWQAGMLPILTGGTGLYLKAVMEGLSPIPEIPESIRAEARTLLAEMGNAAFHNRLAKHDPLMAERLDSGNSQRLARAWEVVTATGRSLAEWQDEPREGAVEARWFSLVLDPERPRLYAQCESRFRAMVTAGALDEVRDFEALRLPPDLPIQKALGRRELAAHLAGETDLDTAIAAACQATRNYAKRQGTWFRHQMMASLTASEQLSESLIATIFLKIRQHLLTAP
ncbi:tRNA (adenosine(37)-N6)-dimethylallyltransferase MiaA [Paramagnetospirillum magneticum]|uniref:tRNA dimethylallyltransferase n=1 Tax=Paramagnetospirillum magneticum (strain ATCC 700264 / AMB-1) TaxID=342108 RepID=MIAA_PARM1|nr:tRNA (adenosine(37)-N6)-dimethylallyltransferase MiaA [Paramagnetospirillum magneticum]Q2W1G5.1 RecName: Full=tRNA dimethylallyltransferase; AltName: Full=Dimethylallyl diphosphate:tRNA dimethylallyltransferase; Short=DMAPP:tRNA dimethylallyltransferase; Short=DMATase; AltName: Full=Isopentenyl-diphosphate:tRNA isopentenyltransferase; Short=IPP transferase; Short=IPPT; Short=IPTase [Paramagnetospirillum magneticum AMB-1]BAE52310.1 tRNA delta(2)-isopentenylpyrophosphate transferase [Paramagneto